MTILRLLIMMSLSIGFVKIGMADCTLSLPCGQCNAGSFTATCSCHDSSGFQCDGCTGNCVQGGCCCGHNTAPPFAKSCSSTSCGNTVFCGTGRLILPGGESVSPIASSSPGFPALVLAVLKKVPESAQTIPGTVSGTDIPIEVDVPPDAPIEITDVKLPATSRTFSGGSFKITNLSDKNLIAYSVAMNLYFDTMPSHPIQMRVVEDGWFLNQYVLKPGESKEGVIRTSLTAPIPVKLTRVTVVPDYLEFSGGEALGANSSAVGAALARSRNVSAQFLRGYCAKLKSGQSATSVLNTFGSDLKAANQESRASRLGMNQLSAFLKYYGSGAFVKACQEPIATRAY